VPRKRGGESSGGGGERRKHKGNNRRLGGSTTPRPVGDEGGVLTGRNRENREALQASEATMFLTGINKL
jgi:hypothetical protein